MRLRLIGTWLSGICLLGAPGEVPTFEQFKAGDIFTGKAAAPVLRTQYQKKFRTRIQQAAGSSPNFAGHYTVVEWGCGAGCVSIAVVDCKNGATFDAPSSGYSLALGYDYEGGEEQLAFRPDRRLIVFRGCPGETDCGTYYYEFTDNQFKLLRKAPAAQKPSR